MQIRDWDDLRVFLAVAREGSLASAARALRVDHATVSRRIRALEERVGARLFDRIPGAWTPTAAGEEMRAVALRVETDVQSLDRSVAGSDARLTGPLRVALSDVAGYAFADALAAFSRAQPGIEIQVTASNLPSDLSRREADVAIRATNAPPEHLVGRRLGTVAVSAYLARDLALGAHGEADLARLPWIGWDTERAGAGAGSRWLGENVPDARIVARFDSMLLAHFAARAGLGAAMLPCVVADREPALRRVVPDLVVPTTTLWLITHAQLRASARVRAFLDFLPPYVRALRNLMEGGQPEAWREPESPAPRRARRVG
jgi:DNA-binding transcriptional LysR family regulator